MCGGREEISYKCLGYIFRRILFKFKGFFFFRYLYFGLFVFFIVEGVIYFEVFWFWG